MKSTRLPSLSLLILPILLAMSPLAQGGSWQKKKDVAGIQVFFRESATSNIKELKIQLEVDATLNQLMAVLKDIPAFPSWIHGCSSAKKIQSTSQSNATYYSTIDFPWPLTDRDLIAATSFRQDPSSKIVYLSSKASPDSLPRNKKFVRIEKSHIRWELKPLSEKKVQISYHLISDPGGSIPAWAVNWGLDVGPVKSMKALRKQLGKSKYRKPSTLFVVNY